jgi:hypothetical protein
MNKTEDSNKNRNKICKTMKQHLNIFGYDENKMQEMRTTERKRISKVDAKQTH